MDSHEAKAVLRDQYAAERAKELARDALLCAIHEWMEECMINERLQHAKPLGDLLATPDGGDS